MARLDYVQPLLSDNPRTGVSDMDIRVSDSRGATGRRHIGEGRVVLKVNAEHGSVTAYRSSAIPFEDMLAEATVTSAYTGDRWLSAEVLLTKNLSESSVQRVNRLLKGMGISVSWYHRADALRVRIPPAKGAKVGKRLPLPVTLKVARTSDGEVRIGFKGDKAKAKDEPRRGSAEERAEVRETMAALADGSLKVEPKRPVKTDPTGLFTYPTLRKSSEVVVERETLSGLDTLWGLHTKGVKQVVALTGPTGTGKTSLAYGLAARNHVGIMVFDAAGAREFSDWTGAMQLADGETKFVPSGFLEAIDADGRYKGEPRIVLIDELNRAESSGALNALIPVLHGFGSLYVPELGKSINIDANVLIIATLNRGSAYAGTVGLDLALADRVTAWVELPYLDGAKEATLIVERTGLERSKAEQLARAAHQVRRAAERGELPEGGGVSTRRLLDAAHKAVGGMTLHQAASWSWVGSYPNEGGSSSEAHTVKTAIDGVLRGQ